MLHFLSLLINYYYFITKHISLSASKNHILDIKYKIKASGIARDKNMVGNLNIRHYNR